MRGKKPAINGEMKMSRWRGEGGEIAKAGAGVSGEMLNSEMARPAQSNNAFFSQAHLIKNSRAISRAATCNNDKMAIINGGNAPRQSDGPGRTVPPEHAAYRARQ